MKSLGGISGFPEFLPEHQRIFDYACDLVRKQFQLCGFEGIETPAVERVSTLQAKGADHEIYGLYRMGANGEETQKDIALRFDLTVPLSRYVAQHYGELVFPWRRYQIAPVWRGERAQSGRYRQFYQCDVDVLGDRELDVAYDAEVVGVVNRIFAQLNIKDHVIFVNNAKILRSLIRAWGDFDEIVVMQFIDKLEKVAEDDFLKGLEGRGFSSASAAAFHELLKQDFKDFTALESITGISDDEAFITGVYEVKTLMAHLRILGIPDTQVRFKIALARGLNYYTGNIFEIKLLNSPGLGSVCGGGRYDDLVGCFCKHKVPGVGVSLGLSRLIQVIIERGCLSGFISSAPKLFFSCQDKELLPEYIRLNSEIRDLGVSSDIYLGDKSLGAQMRYADKKGFKFVVIMNRTDWLAQKLLLRYMRDGSQSEISLSNLAEIPKLIDKLNGC